MNNKPFKKFEKAEKPQPPRKVRVEIYDDGIYVGTINTEFVWNQKHPVAEENLLEYVHKKFPTRNKKYLTVKIV